MFLPSLLGFEKIKSIAALTKTNEDVAAAQVMMDARINEGITLNSESMSLYYNLLKSVGVLTDADIERIKNNQLAWSGVLSRQ